MPGFDEHMNHRQGENQGLIFVCVTPQQAALLQPQPGPAALRGCPQHRKVDVRAPAAAPGSISGSWQQHVQGDP